MCIDSSETFDADAFAIFYATTFSCPFQSRCLHADLYSYTLLPKSLGEKSTLNFPYLRALSSNSQSILDDVFAF